METTDVYLLPYHSFPPTSCLAAASGHFASVEKAIAAKEWPYDNGDDPSFFVARHDGGLLTWGVCRQDVRNKIRRGSICVFFAFTKDKDVTRYRMSAVATVSEKLDRQFIFQDPRFHDKNYINILIRPKKNGWVYDENDRPRGNRHADWLWRITVHGATGKKEFDARNKDIRTTGHIGAANADIARNYVVFSERPDETYISPHPPFVAAAKGSAHECWDSDNLERLTVSFAAIRHPRRRHFLRSKGKGYVHRQLTFNLPVDEAVEWRRCLISALRQESVVRSS